MVIKDLICSTGLFLAACCLFVAAGNLKLPCDFLDSVNITDGALERDGSIMHDSVRYDVLHYAKVNYSYDASGAQIYVPDHIRGCVCQVKSCVWVCCPTELIIYEDHYPSCQIPAFQIIVNMVSDDGRTEKVDLMTKHAIFKALRSEACEDLSNAHPEEWDMNFTGYVSSLGDARILQHEYCLLAGENGELAELYYCPQNNGEKEKELSISSTVGIILSIPFLLATLFIYACIPELRNIHGKSLICYILALTFAYVMLLLINFHCSFIPCNVMGYMLYFSVLVSFFWLNVMCFDIFWTFSSGVVIKNERKRFIHYALYAFGCPTVILIIALVFDHTELIVEEYRPRFGEYGCFIFRDKLVEFIYFYLPLLILVMANLYFFVVTAIRIVRIQHATDVALRNGSRRHSKFEKDRHRFSLYLRLFIVMGVTWTFEIVSWAVGSSDWFFYVSDVCNCLLGVIIFFLFVWKQKVRQLVVKRIGNHQELRRRKSTSASVVSSTGATKFTSIQDSTVTQPPVNA
ncbi:G-protein coupled receptor Mth2-like isoform X2 [Topomyia yanbarensis]|uniref:G-protein coupled receptor Mth2-like isoform X2 n=1 Tax=Topomyia yanbarensis TaxID=2498891 RepID=UPI00273B6567|nr:G-protein coupled receptor Mth2-like isoform X2 [Topomyia yanbarensis]